MSSFIDWLKFMICDWSNEKLDSEIKRLADKADPEFQDLSKEYKRVLKHRS